MRHDAWSTNVGIHDLVIEVDLNFDGQNDILLFDGAHMNPMSTHDWFRRYELFLQVDGRLVHVPSFSNLCNPHLDVERQRIVTSALSFIFEEGIEGVKGRRGCSFGSRIYEFVGQELVMIGEADLDRRERLLINGVWQEFELCGERTADGWMLCNDYGEDDLMAYERIFGENPYWHLRIYHADPSTWHE